MADSFDIQVTADQVAFYDRNGYLIVPGLFSPELVAKVAEHFKAMIANGPIAGHWPAEPDSTDPLKRFPRLTHPHRFDEISKSWLLHRGVYSVLKAILRDEPIAVQSMYYFKPPGAKGQALHQDDFYLMTRPQPCMAAWTAIDPSQPENGGLSIVPGSHRMDIVCPRLADQSESFTTHYVAPPPGHEAISAKLNPGDTLFFPGNVIHGSGPNRSQSWRRSFICHYVPSKATNIARWFKPAFTFDGREYDVPSSELGGPCGEEFTPFWESLTEDAKRKFAESA